MHMPGRVYAPHPVDHRIDPAKVAQLIEINSGIQDIPTTTVSRRCQNATRRLFTTNPRRSVHVPTAEIHQATAVPVDSLKLRSSDSPVTHTSLSLPRYTHRDRRISQLPSRLLPHASGTSDSPARLFVDPHQLMARSCLRLNHLACD